ncbi:MAG: DUF86 domain-containing protein [Verrucomicrobia bacterium]|nr:DUF86 domain-containing protein [Verrucomicrobiota bacterium]
MRKRLEDILDAITELEPERSQDRESYDADKKTRVFVLHYIQIIGEAVRRIDPAWLGSHPTVPWRRIVGTRNILVHDYGGVDYAILWQILQEDIPVLKTEIQKILAAESGSEPQQPNE